MKAAAVLLDLAFVLHRLWKPLGSRTATANEIRAFAERCIRTAEEELFRIYCYHCRPYGETETHPLTRTPIDFSSTDTFVNMTALIRELGATRPSGRTSARQELSLAASVGESGCRLLRACGRRGPLCARGGVPNSVTAANAN